MSARPETQRIALLSWGALGICLHIGLARFGYGVILPALQAELELDYTAAGLLNALHLAGYLAGTLSGAAMGQRLGMYDLGRLGHWMVFLGAVACALATGTTVLGLGRLATGLGAGWAVIAILVTVLGSMAEGIRARASVLICTGMAAALLGCGILSPWLLEAGWWRAEFVVAAMVALTLALGFPAPCCSPAPQPQDAKLTLHEFAGGRWIWLVATYFCFGVGYIAYATFAGANLSASNADALLVMLAWTAAGAATTAGSLLTLWVLGRPRLAPLALAGAMALSATGAAIGALAQPVAALVGAVLVGGGFAAIPALITAAVRTRSSAAAYARAFSVATAALGLGQFLGPVLAGALADLFGPLAAPLFGAFAYAAGAGFAAIDLRQSV